MDVDIKCWIDPDYCGGDCQSMKVNGENKLNVGGLSECPEDAIIGRALVDCVQVSQLMATAHKAGADGEKLNINISETKNRDDI